MNPKDPISPPPSERRGAPAQADLFPRETPSARVKGSSGRVQQDAGEFNVVFVHSSIDDAGLSPAEFRIYCHLARRANGGEAWPSVVTMATTCRLNRTTVRAAVDRLVALNMVEVRERPGTSNVYVLTRASEWRIPTPEAGAEGVGSMGQDCTPPPNEGQVGSPKMGGVGSPRLGGDPSQKRATKDIQGRESMEGPTTPPAGGSAGGAQNLQKLKDGWCDRWRETFGRAYNFRGAQDTEACKRLLRICGKDGSALEVEAILGIAGKAWKLNGVHTFLQQRSVQLAAFASFFDQISVAVGAIRANGAVRDEGRFASWRVKP